MKLLANPALLRAAIVFIFAGFAFLLGLIFMRQLRNSIAEESEIDAKGSSSLETLPLNLYNTVIQQLKQQKHELQMQSQAEQQRARTSENFSLAVLSNLSCGVLVFGANGLVKSANPAAKALLGYGALNGMSPENIFRTAASSSETAGVFPDHTSDDPARVVEEIKAVLREGSKRRQIEADYDTPGGEKRFLSITVSQIAALDGSLLGVACLINDRTEIENIRRQQELHGELSAEMALQLRTSLTTIAGYAQQLANNRDPELAKQLAMDIAQEAGQLDRSIGGFLSAAPAKPKTAGAGTC